MDGPLGLRSAHDTASASSSISTSVLGLQRAPPAAAAHPPRPTGPTGPSGPTGPLAAPARRPLQPPSHHRQHQRRPRARTTSSGTATSPSSASVSGHSFTVANFNRGIIYLRPVVRAPTHSHHHSPPSNPFAFPSHTLLDSAALDLSNDGYDSRSDYTTLPPALAEEDARDRRPANFTTPSRPPAAHSRSRSFSTIDAHTVTSHSTEPGTFKVVIERPPFARPKTADTSSAPLLEVPIPHYRLGTPRFSAHGTPILRSSVYTRASGTDDIRSTLLSPLRATHSFLSSRPRSEAYSSAPPNYRTTMELTPGQHAASVPSSARVSKLPIGPEVYDALTVNPDDHAVVRFSPSGDILGATPSRLVAHITSPSFLDYELLSDFFLTFRSFLPCRDLAAYLISRLQWAVNRQDDFGRIVRVRTFVALRHWILNYFVDDFVPVYSLRVHFCQLVNSLYNALRVREDGGGGDIKIVGELKKCWRRTCALHWDSDDGIGSDLADEDLLPGGQPGSSIAYEEPPQSLPLPSTPPRQAERTAKVETLGSNPSDQFACGPIDWPHGVRHTPQNSLTSPFVPSQDFAGTRVPLSPESERSIPVLSCSIPMRVLHRGDPPPEVPLYPHPVPNTATPRFAASPQFSSPTKKPNRPSHSHKRSGSFSDALRDQRAPLPIPKNAPPDTRLSALSIVPGSLIRGGVFQPSSPYIDVKNGGLRHTRSHLELEQIDGIGEDVHIRGGHGPNPGMKKIFGTVRRALSSKQPSASAPHLSGAAHSHHTATPNRSSNPASVSTASGGVHKRRYARPRPQVRIDLLASKVVDSFREAINQQVREDQHPQPSSDSKGDLSEFVFDFENKETPTAGAAANSSGKQDPRIYSSITAGSKSIVIMDDTGPPGLPLMSGALPSPPTEADAVMPPGSVSPQLAISTGEQPAESTNPIPTHAIPPLDMDSNTASDMEIPAEPATHAPTRRRSMSDGREQMHSFRRRGSTKASMGRPTSLRRHASHNSGLSRHDTTASIATFQTMSSHNDPFFFDRQPTAPAAPVRQLRRRPGGDLRAVDNVHDLEHIQRPASTGSISNHTHSIVNSVILRSDRFVESSSGLHSAENAEQPEVSKKPISLVDTHSSQPNLRPSFEAEVAKLAALPDDTDDDGGIEAALMKLEGRYEKKSPDPSPRATLTSPHDVAASSQNSIRERGTTLSTTDLHQGRQPTSPGANNQGLYQSSTENFHLRIPDAPSGVGSDDSYSATPLLDRFPSDVIDPLRPDTFQSMASSAKPEPLKPNSPPTWFDKPSASELASPSSSVEHVVETESMKKIPKNGTMPRSSVPRESFLLDDDEDLSDMTDDASAMVSRSDGTSHGIRSFFDDEPAVAEDDKGPLPMHPLHHPPTPPLTANKLGHSPQVSTTVFDRGLPTPGLTPTSRLNNQPFGDGAQLTDGKTEAAIELQELKKDDNQPPPAHLPFVLAYDSEILAQQFTLIEKDALDEVDWKELIELRWKQSSPRIRDWVEYLRTQDARGVDVVIARFNLVVKWVVSEILLTEAIEERARCIVKYIHIAAHARRLRNYATMYQITIALLSSDISRLKHTWAFIPASEMHTMRTLEALVQPLRNFHNLRVEMETASVEEGCIPFIGIYTRDLIYNAQKPAFIDAPPVDGERLVNFERHHTAAMIVKSLLRLIEASAKYTFRPDSNIISRCLWMAALTDEEITKLSRRYE